MAENAAAPPFGVDKHPVWTILIAVGAALTLVTAVLTGRIDDVRDDVRALDAKVVKVREDLSAEVAQVREEVAKVREDLGAEIAKVREDLGAEIGKVREDLNYIRGYQGIPPRNWTKAPAGEASEERS